MPRTSQTSTTREKETALRSRGPHVVTTGSSTYSCIRPGAQTEAEEADASEIMACVQRAGMAAT